MALLRRRGQEEEPEFELPASAFPAAEAEPEPAPAVQEPAPIVGAELPELSSPEPTSQFQLVEGAEEMLDMPLGTLIFRAGLIAPQQLEDALAEGLRTGKRLGEVLLSRGWLTEEDLSKLLAGQKGLPYIDPEHIAIDQELARRLSYEDARQEMALPLVEEFGVPVVAMTDPTEDGIDRLRSLLGGDVRIVVAPPTPLQRTIEVILGNGVAPMPQLGVAPVAPSSEPPLEALVESETPPVVSIEPAYADQPYEQPAAEAPSYEPELTPPNEGYDAVAPPAEEGALEPSALDPAAMGEADQFQYPSFENYEILPAPESLGQAPDHLPAEMQMDGAGMYGADGYAAYGTQAEDAVPWPTHGDETEVAAEAEPQFDAAGADTPDVGMSPEPVADLPAPAAVEDTTVDEQVAVADVDQEPVAEDEPSVTPAWARGEVSPNAAEVMDASAAASTDEPAAAFDDQALANEAVAPAAEAVQAPVEEQHEPAPTEADPPPPVAAQASTSGHFDVILRLMDGEHLLIESFSTLEAAQGKAQELIGEIASVEPGKWPFIGGRFLRPDTVLSVDIDQHGGWGGSGRRSSVFQG